MDKISKLMVRCILLLIITIILSQSFYYFVIKELSIPISNFKSITDENLTLRLKRPFPDFGEIEVKIQDDLIGKIDIYLNREYLPLDRISKIFIKDGDMIEIIANDIDYNGVVEITDLRGNINSLVSKKIYVSSNTYEVILFRLII